MTEIRKEPDMKVRQLKRTESDEESECSMDRGTVEVAPGAKRTLAFVCSMINCLSAGSILLVSLYAPIFQEKLHYSQVQVNAVSIAGELGMYLPVPLFGYICDRIGPGHLSLLSAIFFAPAYLLAAYAYTHELPYYVMLTAFVFIGAGTSSMYFSGVTTCVKNFTGSRGLALALPIAAFGLSSLWEAQFISRVFGRADGHELDLEKVFNFFAGFLLVVGVLGSIGLSVVSDEDLEDLKSDVESSETEGLLPNTGSSRASGYGAVEVEHDEEKDDGILNAETKRFLFDRNMWYFAFGFFLVTGAGEAFINNIGVIIQTFYPPGSAPHSVVSPTNHVSIVALTSTIARLIAGSLSDYLAPHFIGSTAAPKRFTCSRVSLLLGFALIMSAGQLLLATGIIANNPQLFYLVSSTIGTGYGAVFTLAPTVVSVVWGTKNFGTNWGIVTVTPALGAALFGGIFAVGYDRAAKKQEWGGICYGGTCYETSYALMGASVIAAVGVWCAVWKMGWVRRGVCV